MIQHDFINTKHILSLIDYLTALQDDYNFYALSVHGVGFEWRIIRKSDNENYIYWISITVVSKHKPDLYVAKHGLFDSKNQRWKLTDEQYEMLSNEIELIWKKQGEQWQDRGLY